MNKQFIKKIISNPDADRAASTLNNISEHMFDLVSLELAIEAAVYWRNEFERVNTLCEMAASEKYYSAVMSEIKEIKELNKLSNKPKECNK